MKAKTSANRGARKGAGTVEITIREKGTGRKMPAFRVDGETFHAFEAIARNRGMTWQKFFKTILQGLFIQKRMAKGVAA